MNKTQLINALMDLDPNLTKANLLKQTKANLQTVLNDLQSETGDATDDEPTGYQGSMLALKKAKEHYVVVAKANGSKSINNGDAIATLLLNLTLDEVAFLADEVKEVAIGTHKAKYSHLNNGQIRMNCGNVVRGAIKRGTKTVEEITELAR